MTFRNATTPATRPYVPVISSRWGLAGVTKASRGALKEREREFNQAEILARHLSVATNIPLNTKLLRRVTATMTQTRLTKQQRSENMRGAFAVRAGVKLNGERVVLVDDVFTTGATTSACAQALRAAGAGEVCVWTVARGL